MSHDVTSADGPDEPSIPGDGLIGRILDGKPIGAEGDSGLRAEVGALGDAGLGAVHGSLRRRGAAEMGRDSPLGALLAIVRSEMIDRRERAEVEAVVRPLPEERPGDEPARRRILGMLRLSPTTNAVLSTQLGLARETVSRILRALHGEGHVTFEPDPDDRRRRVYRVTASGSAVLARSEAVLGPAPVPALPDDAEAEYLVSAIHGLRDRRRFVNDLERAEARARAVVARAREIGRDDIQILARKELITTLRQAARWDELQAQIDELDLLIESGALDSKSIAPAMAHLSYEQGRLPSADGSALADRARDLAWSAERYEKLALARTNDVDNWHLRSAWATAGLAEVLREQTELGKALRQARLAQLQFAAGEDAYGLARSLFLEGFCFRLRGMYEHAKTPLRSALELAEKNGFSRWRADALMQLGDVSRCTGDHDAAIEYLRASLELAEELTLTVTMAFATSALGATHYALGEHETAVDHLRRADHLFAQRRHIEGEALTKRRLAVGLRMLGDVKRSTESARKALDSYTNLVSPAGIAACFVEIIEGMHESRSSTIEMQKVLCAYIQRPTPRRLIELDPAAPQLLHELAQRVEDEDLFHEASEILENARARLAEQHRNEARLLQAASGLARDFGEDDASAGERTHPADVQWTWPVEDDAWDLVSIFDSQNVMGVEPRRDTERQVAA